MTDDQHWCLMRADRCKRNGHANLDRMFREASKNPETASRQRFVATVASEAAKSIRDGE